MGQIQIDYEQVYSRTAQLKAYINNDLLTKLDNEYSAIQSILDGMDGRTNAKLKETVESNRQKSIMVARTLEKLLSFMDSTSKEFQRNEQKMAKELEAGAEGAQGGEK